MNTRMIDELRDGRAGTAVLPGDTDWGENPPIYPPPGDPAVVVRPETPEQVGEALRFAAAEGIGVGDPQRRSRRPAVRQRRRHWSSSSRTSPASRSTARRCGSAAARSGATSRPARAARPGAHLRRHQERRRRRTDPRRRCRLDGARVRAGDRQPGRAPRSCSPSGEVVTASADENPDLFWALRGGGGNFGVVTTFVFEAHPLDGVVFGTLTYDVERAAEVLKGWRDVMREAPEKFNSTFMAMPAMGPGMEAAAQVIVSSTRDAIVAAPEPQLGEAARAARATVSEDVAAKDYADALEDAHPFEGPMPVITGDNGFADDLSDAAIDALVAAHASLAAGVLMVRYLRGAFNRVPADATAWAFRDAEVMLMLAAFLPPDAPRELIDGVHATWKPVLPFTRGHLRQLRAGGRRRHDRADLPAEDARAAARGEAQLRPAEPAEPQPQRGAVAVEAQRPRRDCSCSTSFFASARPRFGVAAPQLDRLDEVAGSQRVDDVRGRARRCRAVGRRARRRRGGRRARRRGGRGARLRA